MVRIVLAISHQVDSVNHFLAEASCVKDRLEFLLDFDKSAPTPSCPQKLPISWLGYNSESPWLHLIFQACLRPAKDCSEFSDGTVLFPSQHTVVSISGCDCVHPGKCVWHRRTRMGRHLLSCPRQPLDRFQQRALSLCSNFLSYSGFPSGTGNCRISEQKIHKAER